MHEKILITGGSGLLGRAIRSCFSDSSQIFYTYLNKEERDLPGLGIRLDLRDPDNIHTVFATLRPKIVVHAAASMKERDFSTVIVEGSRRVAESSRAIGAELVHISTDMVFDGENAPYDEEAAVRPISPYGRAKAEAEILVRRAHADAILVRTSLLFSLDPPDARTQRTIDALRSQQGVRLFTDEIRCPAAVEDLAGSIETLVHELLSGVDPGYQRIPPILHLAGPQSLTRFEFESQILKSLGESTDGIEAATIRELGLQRPRDLRLASRATPARFSECLRPVSRVIEDHLSRQQGSTPS